ncbi:hypothetical protein GCM10023320_11660 [Pseudonocardia adelaidensis]|uniref:Restriction endonuclease n=2 Tax=Pseudonocardia adelaidensis TaxID=648754 RepID=A0ABP9NCA6_9PSEU
MQAFVKNVQPAAVQIAIDWDQANQVARSPLGVAAIRGDRLTKTVAARLASAGGYVATNTADELDIVAEFPILGTSVGRLVVEVKARYSNRAIHRRAETQLRQAMRKTGSLLGLLVYGGPSDVRTKLMDDTRSQDSLFGEFDDGILVVSAEELVSWSDRQLIGELTRLRNAVVHGQR